MRRTIIEYGGKVVDINYKAHFLIKDDGSDMEIWKNGGETIDDKNR